MTRPIIQVWSLVITFFSLFYINAVFAHGRVSLESDICVRNMGGSMVHLSTYQPQYDPEAEYCTEIPQAGEFFWVLDLVDDALRNMPIIIQLVTGSENDDSKTLISFNSKNHPDGVIKGEFNLNEGDYTMRIIGEGVPPLHYEYPLRVQMVNYMDAFRTAMPYLIMVLLLSWLSTKFMKRKKVLINK
ncbi:hypothetical protein [Nitrosomonas ureae]|uniref:Uncharacterized protein n=1 Tax=Nitrosomonas ureae TaxID=44577 RepID=A0A1H5YAJ0_9PROT|nr:hypothetical protein [Nitrosomonas ureae]SEG20456.1 hypothetical protein SAMN05216334_14210 [Nitrosomonas ureae]